MAIIFLREDAEHDQATDSMFAGQAAMRLAGLVFMVVLVVLLVSVPSRLIFSKTHLPKSKGLSMDWMLSSPLSTVWFHLIRLGAKKA